ncbi:MAG: glycosyltransferase family 4 protein [Rhodospirillaceae bacterium]|jgi:glycosyltransferase involved in cell wall biosynthesis|nr:glycosyltransferase family 4 protein [Rhodospirillaceae bacterium]MBT6116970.1 glycosyltransferase family 4 protein [Rhodospirillaceae bacterium]
MKICQLCAVDFTLRHFLLPLMEGMRTAGHEVVGVCSEGPLLTKVRAAGFRIEPVEIARSYNLLRHIGTYRKLVTLFRREAFDIVHVHTPVAALIGRLAAARAGVPCIVYTAHGFYFHDHMPAAKRLAHIALEWLGGRFTHVLFTQAREDAETARRLRLTRARAIEAIGNGVDPARFAPPADPAAHRAQMRTALGTPEDAVVVAVVGRLVAEKGYPELFEAMAGLAAEPIVELWVVGERLASDHASAIDESLAKIASAPALAGRIRLLGYRADVADLLHAADIFTLPSHREGMPRSIIEAMFCGLPVVATDIRGSREEVVPGETGALVPVQDSRALAEALNRLIRDPALRATQGTAGRARALVEFDEARVVARQLALLGLA